MLPPIDSETLIEEREPRIEHTPAHAEVARVVSDSPYGDDGWRWVELGFDGEKTHLLLARRQDDQLSSKPTVVFIDADVEGVIGRLEKAGVEIITAPRKAPWNPGQTFAESRDSEGNWIVLNSQ